MKITITHQEDKEIYTFNVKNPDLLTSKEVSKICKKMNVKIIFVNGRIYKDRNYTFLYFCKKKQMKNFFFLLCIILTVNTLCAQTKLNIFSNDGHRFYLIINGVKQNEKATERVETNISGSNKYFITIIFSNDELPNINEELSIKPTECKVIDYSIIATGGKPEYKTSLVKSSEINCLNGLSGTWLVQLDGGNEIDTVKIVDNNNKLSFYTNANNKFSKLEITVEPKYKIRYIDTLDISWKLDFTKGTSNISNLNLQYSVRKSLMDKICSKNCPGHFANNDSFIRYWSIVLPYAKYKSDINLFYLDSVEHFICNECIDSKRNPLNQYDNIIYKISFRRL
jgi:hypothetical protein